MRPTFSVWSTLAIVFILCVNGLIDESSVRCVRIDGQCEKERAGQNSGVIYFALMLSFPDHLKRDSLVGAFDDGHDIAPATYLAAEQINNRSDLLSDYEVKLMRVDGGCNVTERSVVGLHEIVCSCKPIVGIIGPTCGTSSMVVSQIVGNEKFSLVTIHYGQREILGDRSRFPYAFGILGSHSIYVEAMVALVKQNDWTRIAVLFSEDDIDIARGKAIQEGVRALPNFEVSFAAAIYDNYIPLEEIMETFTRVIIILGTPGIILRSVCLAYHKHMLFPNYQWVFMERIDSDFHNVSFTFNGNAFNCSDSDISTAINGGVDLLLGAVGFDDTQTTTNIGITHKQYKEGYSMYTVKYANEFNVSSNEVDWAMGFYDAMWSLAFALNESLRELNITQVKTGSNILAQTIAKHMLNIEFQGISGGISFDNETGYNKDTSVDIYQYWQSENVSSTRIGVYTQNNFTLFGESNPQFINALFEENVVHVDVTVAGILLSFTILILPLAISLQAVNIVYRDHKAIKASSPWLNHLIFFGCYFIVLSTVTYILTESYIHLSGVLRQHLCNIIPWFLSTGTTLIIGTVFMRTWRLHRIYTLSKRFSVASVTFLNNKLLCLAVVLLSIIDILVCLIWVSVDKLKTNKTTEVKLLEGGEFPVVFVYNSCSSDFTVYWLVVLLAPKVALTLGSFFLALSTRFNMKEFTTKNVVILVYLMMILSGIMVSIYAVISVIDVDITIRVTVFCLFLDLTIYTSICLLFIPPIHTLVKAKHCFVLSNKL